MGEKTTIGCGTLAAMAVILAMILLPLGYWGARVYFADEIGRGNAHIQINSAENRIGQYDYFFNLCASVQTNEAGIEAETKRLETTNDSVERSRINANISGMTAARANGINDYNSRAKRDYTSGQFLASNLPYQLSTDPYVVGGPKTKCGI